MGALPPAGFMGGASSGDWKAKPPKIRGLGGGAPKRTTILVLFKEKEDVKCIIMY